VVLTSGEDCNSGMQKRIHFRTGMEHYMCRPVNNNNVSLGYQFCKNITFILYIIYNVRYNSIHLFPLHKGDMKICSPEKSHISRGQHDYFEGEQIHISLMQGKECFIPPGQRFGEF
jgi:hypothetical protein